MNFQLTLVASVAITFVASVNFCFGQSTVVGRTVTGPPSSASSSVKTPARDFSLPNSLSSQQRHWESILDRPATGLLNRIVYCEELISRLRELGLPVFLDQTAKEDSLSLDQELDIQYDGVSLRAVLAQTLAEFNATIAFREDSISIISLDNAWDSEFLQTVVYDVSSIAGDIDSLGNLAMSMRQLIEPDSWDGGTGSGVSQPQIVGGRHLVSVCNTYEVHREVQKWLRSLNHLKGGSIPMGENLRGRSGGSTVVSSRSQNTLIQPEVGRGFSGGGFGGGGIGGFGGGGGVF